MAKYKNLFYTHLGSYKGQGDEIPDRPNTNAGDAGGIGAEDRRKKFSPSAVLDSVEINGEYTKRDMRLRQLSANGSPIGTILKVAKNTLLALP